MDQIIPQQHSNKKMILAIISVCVGVALLIFVVIFIAKSSKVSQKDNNTGIQTVTLPTNEEEKTIEAKKNSEIHALYLKSIGDDDGDGLSNQDEAKYGTNKNLTDSDGDNLSDYFEISEGKTDPLKLDSDSDGITDWNE